MNRRPAPKIGAERYLVETISAIDAESVARKNGWDGNPESLLDHCDVGRAALECCDYATLDEAVAAARASLMKGGSLFGAVDIYHEIFEHAHDDRGRHVKDGSWETQASWEVDANGEIEKVQL